MAAVRDGVQVLDRFERLAGRLGKLHHPNLPAVLSFGGERRGANVHLCVATEKHRGRSINEVVKERGAFTLTRFISVAAQILKALGYAHDHAIAHRGLTPACVVMVERPAGDLQITVHDLGLAELFEYPEDATKTVADHILADIRALGDLFTYMLTGTEAWMADDALLPSELVELVTACRNARRDTGPTDANEVLELLIDRVPAHMFRPRCAPVVNAVPARAPWSRDVPAQDSPSRERPDIRPSLKSLALGVPIGTLFFSLIGLFVISTRQTPPTPIPLTESDFSAKKLTEQQSSKASQPPVDPAPEREAAPKPNIEAPLQDAKPTVPDEKDPVEDTGTEEAAAAAASPASKTKKRTHPRTRARVRKDTGTEAPPVDVTHPDFLTIDFPDSAEDTFLSATTE